MHNHVMLHSLRYAHASRSFYFHSLSLFAVSVRRFSRLYCMALSKCGDVSRSSVATRRPIDLLRAHWVELEDRVWADHITGKLFEREMISMRDKEEIEGKARGSRREGAVLLLEMMMTSSWCACVDFAVILSETERLKDLGEKLLRDAGLWGVLREV